MSNDTPANADGSAADADAQRIDWRPSPGGLQHSALWSGMTMYTNRMISGRWSWSLWKEDGQIGRGREDTRAAARIAAEDSARRYIAERTANATPAVPAQPADDEVKALGEALEPLRPVLAAAKAERVLADSIFFAVDDALDVLVADRKGIRDTINWGNLQCASVLIGTEYGGNNNGHQVIRVLIEEAAPECPALHEAVRKALLEDDTIDLTGYELEIATEW